MESIGAGRQGRHNFHLYATRPKHMLEQIWAALSVIEEQNIISELCAVVPGFRNFRGNESEQVICRFPS